MKNQQDSSWFREECKEQGSAFSMKVKCCLHQEQSAYQHIAIYDCEFWGPMMAIDGFVMLTAKDNYLYHEMMSHPVLYSHPNPHDVVIIGGGDCGVLKEVLKHPGVSCVKQIEIDERVTRLAQQYFPDLCVSNEDPRATLLFEDGIEWMQQAPDNSVDIMIIDSTDPIGPAKGLFGVHFYQQCQRVLRSDGILVHQSESPMTHLQTILKPMHQAMRQAGFSQTRTLFFPQPCYPSGWWSATMASTQTILSQFRQIDAMNRNFHTHYYNEQTHQGALALPEGLKSLFL